MSLLFALACLPLLSHAINTTLLPAPLITAETCGFQGDDSIYGLGVRLGLYLQWFATCLADNFLPDEAIAMRGVNVCFQLSTLIALLYITVTRSASQLYAVEVWLLLSLCIGGVASTPNIAPLSTDKKVQESSLYRVLLKLHPTFTDHRATAIGVIIRICLGSAMTFYGVWFVYIGMDEMAHPPCSRAALFFKKVDLYHGFRTFLKAIFTFYAVAWSVAIITDVPVALLAVNEETAPPSVQDEEKTELRTVWFALDFVAYILSTEYVIKWNHISGVDSLGSTGQLIPLIIGGAGFVKVLYKFIMNCARKKYRLKDDFTCTFVGFYSIPIWSLPRKLERKLIERVNGSVAEEKAGDSDGARSDIESQK